MRYLWIEDFNEGKDESDLKPKWIKYYDLTANELIIKKSLISALEYIEENPNGFDAVLLDINLPIGERIGDKDYKDYLNNIVSDKYLKLDLEDMKNKAGFLIFLKLMIDNRFPKERIVFLSGNVDSEKIIEIDNMLSVYRYYLNDLKIKDHQEFINKINENDVDYDNYEGYKVDLIRVDPEIKKKLDDIIKDKNDIEACIKLLKQEKTRLLKAKVTSSEDSKASKNTYNRMEPIFLEAGFNPPYAFEKPSDSIYDKLSWEFIEYKEKVKNPYYEIRGSIIEMCEILISKLKKIEDNDPDKFIIFNDLYIKSYTSNSKKSMYKKEHFKDLLIDLQTIFSVSGPSDLGIKGIYRQVVKEISHDWETAINVYYPNKKSFTYCKGKNKDYKLYDECDNFKDFAQKSAYGAIMKSLRNWTAHSRLTSFSEEEVGFLFIIAMRSFFNIDDKVDMNYYQNDKDKNYNYYEMQLLKLASKNLSLEQLMDKFKVKTITNKQGKRVEKRDIERTLIESFNMLSGDDPKKHLYTYDVFEKVKNIGSSDSDTKCYIDHIYRLFWHSMFNSYLEYFNDDYVKPNLKFCDEDELYISDNDNILTYIFMYTYYKAFPEQIKCQNRHTGREFKLP